MLGMRTHVIDEPILHILKLKASASPYAASRAPKVMRIVSYLLYGITLASTSSCVSIETTPKERALSLINHAWDSYITHAFPADEVRPLSCNPYGPNPNATDLIGDTLANVSLTLLDNLDTLIVLEQWDRLRPMLQYLKQSPNLFNQNYTVQVFELSIRALGGLMSAHLFLTDANFPSPDFAEISSSYDGFLLDLAEDLGRRLIQAYKTNSAIPYPRVNLMTGVAGVPKKYQTDACTAGAATPILEFTLLSRLTADPQYEHYSQLAFWKLWTFRLPLDLLPMTVDPIANLWKDSLSGIGASIDSFYEHTAKSAIIFNDDKLWSVFQASYKALMVHAAMDGGPDDAHMLFPNVDTTDGHLMSKWIDSLSAFWGGLQVLAGQLTDATKLHVMYLKIWNTFDLIPERWIFNHFDDLKAREDGNVPLEWWPLRPEFIETTYYLYRATRDPFYLEVGMRILHLFETRFKAECGFAGYQDVRTGTRQDRMESFVIGETLKYLYLLFDTSDENILHSSQFNTKNWVFSTEAHPLWVSDNATTKGKTTKNKSGRFQKKDGSRKGKAARKNPPNAKPSASISKMRNSATSKVVNIPLSGIGTKHLYTQDSFDARFSQCEINPMRPLPNTFHELRIYSMPLFLTDYRFRTTLILPRHILDKKEDGSCIELSSRFFKRNAPHRAMSPRAPTTKQIELKLGDMSQLRAEEVSTIQHNASIPLPAEAEILAGDIWVPKITALKILFEQLEPGMVDSRNQLITREYLARADQEGSTRVLRVNKINGVDIKPGVMVWSLPFYVPPDEAFVMNVTENALLSFQDTAIENWAIWYG